ncbi:hypothetical protein HDU67_009081 [Dinochytrium kinnereticum]|nr:hypothetical protein HDU67_009081 [Dinochytrium kinnereticum]
MEAIVDLAQSTYRSLPPGGKRLVDDIMPYGDMAVWTIAMTLLLGLPNLSPKKGSLPVILIAGFCFTLVAIGLYYFASQMALAQIASHYDEEGEAFDATSFLPSMPLDITFGYTRESMTDFFDALGVSGKTAYKSYLYLDLVGIALYTFIHLNIMAFFYPEDDAMAFMTSKLPWAFGAFDLFENVGLLLAMAVGGPAQLSEQYFGRVLSANMTKFALFWVLLGLEAAGIFKLLLGDAGKEREEKVTIAGGVDQKRAEERRKQRLEKKGR